LIEKQINIEESVKNRDTDKSKQWEMEAIAFVSTVSQNNFR
jgi:hypothetical protein